MVSPEVLILPEKIQFSQVLIPTVDSFKARVLMDLILN